MADEIVKKRTRPDRKEAMSVHTEPGDNRKYLEHSMVMLDWPDVNVREPEQVKERMGMYFALCAQDDMKPSVAGMALAFGVDRKTIWAWAKGGDSKTLPAESRTPPDVNILVACYEKASIADRQVLWSLLDRYMTPEQRVIITSMQREEKADVG